MRPRVELIYDTDCPNVEQARELLLRAFSEAKLRPSWKEFDRKAADSPPHAIKYGSPTILVDGKDVAGSNGTNNADCCRLYLHNEGYGGAPEFSQVVRALKGSRGQRFSWPRLAAALPGFVAVLPILHCPACWPAYAGVLSALGLSFLWQAAYLLPITIVLLSGAVFALGYKANARHGVMPMALGVLASAAVLAGKFGLGSDPVVFAGLAMLVVASVWNAWPRKEVCCEKN
jgi:hypothetical protein